MLYTAYEMNRRAGAPVVAASELTARALQALPAPLARTPGVRHMRAACHILANARPTHDRPAFGIETVPVDGRDADVFRAPDADDAVRHPAALRQAVGDRPAA